MLSLSDHPALERWYARNAHTCVAAGTAESMAIDLSRALLSQDKDQPVRWIQSMRSHLQQSENPQALWQGTELLFSNLDTSLADILGAISESSVRAGGSRFFQEALRTCAEVSRADVVRFLSAWYALNTGDLSTCIEECDRIDKPFGPAFTLQGQAFLESGDLSAAEEALKIAIKLSPDELLAWFQLARCHFAGNRFDEAISCLHAARRLAPMSDEIPAFMGLIAESTGNPAHLQPAIDALADSAGKQIATTEACLLGANLAIRVRDHQAAMKMAKGIPRNDQSFRNPAVLARLSQALRSLHDLGWHDVAAEILEKYQPCKKETSEAG